MQLQSVVMNGWLTIKPAQARLVLFIFLNGSHFSMLVKYNRVTHMYRIWFLDCKMSALGRGQARMILSFFFFFYEVTGTISKGVSLRSWVIILKWVLPDRTGEIWSGNILIKNKDWRKQCVQHFTSEQTQRRHNCTSAKLPDKICRCLPNTNFGALA